MRRRARCDDERTTIAAMLPEKSVFGHTLNGIDCTQGSEALCWVLNSIAFDFLVRFRVGGQDVLPHHLRPVALILLEQAGRAGLALSYDAMFTKTTPYDELSNTEVLVLGNLVIAEAYGLGPEDFAHILSTFPVFARKRPAFFAYLRERLAEWSEDVGRDIGVTYGPDESERALLQVAERSMELKNGKRGERE